MDRGSGEVELECLPRPNPLYVNHAQAGRTGNRLVIVRADRDQTADRLANEEAARSAEGKGAMRNGVQVVIGGNQPVPVGIALMLVTVEDRVEATVVQEAADFGQIGNNVEVLDLLLTSGDTDRVVQDCDPETRVLLSIG